MATRSKRAAGEETRALTTVAYRGDELDELIAASSEVRAMNQTELLESQPTFAQTFTDLEDADYEVYDAESAERDEYEEPAPSEHEAEHVEHEEEEPEAEHEPVPESVPVVESTVVIASAELFRQEVSQPAIPIPAFDSQRPVAYDLPSCPSTTSMVTPIAYTFDDGIETAVVRSPARAPALITLTIAVVAITVGVLLGSSFSQALSQSPGGTAAAATGAASSTAPAGTGDAPPTRHAEPRTSVDEKVTLAGSGVVREKATRASKPMGMTTFGSKRPASGAQSQQTSQAAFEAELRAKMLQGEKAAAPSGTDALGEAQLNRPF